MQFINNYNILDKFISWLRHYELFKNQSIVGKKIIDFGCGSNFKDIFKKYQKASKVILIDIYGKNFSKDNLTYINYNNNFNNIYKKLKNTKFDFIFLLAVVEHMDYPEAVLKKLKKFLSKDGKFIITAPSIYSKPVLEFLAFKIGIINKDLVEEHKRYYNLKQHINLAKKSKCNLLKFKYFMLGMNTLAILK